MSDLCIGCKSPVDSVATSHLRENRNEVRIGEDRAPILSSPAFQIGLAVAALVICASFVVNVQNKVPKQTSADVATLLASHAEQEKVRYGVQFSPEDPGVRPVDLEEAKTASIKHLGDSAWTGSQTRMAGKYVDDGLRTGGHIEQYVEDIPHSNKKICSRTIFGAVATARYEKIGNQIIATVATDVDQACPPMGDSLANDAGKTARSTITVKRRYIWKDRGQGIHEWEYSEAPLQHDDRPERIEALRTFEDELKAKQEHTEKMRQLLRQKAANAGAQQNSNY